MTDITPKQKRFIINKLVLFLNERLDNSNDYIQVDGVHTNVYTIAEAMKRIISVSLDRQYGDEDKRLLQHLTKLYKEKEGIE